MNAQLQPIPRAIERPAYDNRRIKYASTWVEDNLKALQTYYVELGKSLPSAADDNRTGFSRAQAFSAFCAVQWDIARGRF